MHVDIPTVTALPAADRAQLLVAAGQQLEHVQDQLHTLSRQDEHLQQVIEALHRARDEDLVAGRVPADLFRDRDLLRATLQRPSSPVFTAFITQAFAELDPAIYGFETAHAADTFTATRLIPKLCLVRGKRLYEVIPDLDRIQWALAVDGIMDVDLLDGRGGRDRLRLQMRGPGEAALIRGRAVIRQGLLTTVLAYALKKHGCDTDPTRVPSTGRQNP